MKTITVGSFEAKNKLSSLLVMAERGQRILITRRGEPVAVLSAPRTGKAGAFRPGPDEIIKEFRAIRAKAQKGAGSAKTLINQGRKR